jgi:hypothetical protein
MPFLRRERSDFVLLIVSWSHPQEHEELDRSHSLTHLRPQRHAAAVRLVQVDVLMHRLHCPVPLRSRRPWRWGPRPGRTRAWRGTSPSHQTRGSSMPSISCSTPSSATLRIWSGASTRPRRASAARWGLVSLYSLITRQDEGAGQGVPGSDGGARMMSLVHSAPGHVALRNMTPTSRATLFQGGYSTYPLLTACFYRSHPGAHPGELSDRRASGREDRGAQSSGPEHVRPGK